MTLLSTHVGSLPRSQKVVDFLFARERGEDYDAEAFDTCMAEAVMENVRRQKEAGRRKRSVDDSREANTRVFPPCVCVCMCSVYG